MNNRLDLQWPIVRGRAKKISFSFGTWNLAPQPPLWVATDISLLQFFFTMRTDFADRQPTISLAYNPIINLGIPTNGNLLFYIEASGTENLLPGNYVFDMGIISTDGRPYIFCGGNIPLLDNVTDLV